MENKFYITTAILYTNGPVHIGFAFELILADVLARYHRQQGDNTWFLTGTDEHGTSVSRAAEKLNKKPIELADEVANQAQELVKILNISNNDFIRTSDQKRHWPSVIKVWNKLLENGDLYKKEYEGLYCVGHESFIKKSDLVDGVCPLHKTKPETVKEENWFFKLTNYKNEIKNKIESGELEIKPESKKNELLNLLGDAEDVSFSRPASKLKWGIPVPNDPESTLYVWADALTNYISALDYASDEKKFNEYWPADIHLVGKDILRFHAIVWPAMLLSVGLKLPKSIYVHGFINVDGQKMSKTVGNVIDPFKIIEKYGADVVRYFLLREIPSDQDGDFSEEKLIARYNGDLANGLGNLVSRVATLIENNMDSELIYSSSVIDEELKKAVVRIKEKYGRAIDNFLLHEALASVWELISIANVYINDHKPWALAKEDKAEFLTVMTNAVFLIYTLSNFLLDPFVPETARKIREVFGAEEKISQIDGYKFIIKKTTPLFPRLIAKS